MANYRMMSVSLGLIVALAGCPKPYEKLDHDDVSAALEDARETAVEANARASFLNDSWILSALSAAETCADFVCDEESEPAEINFEAQVNEAIDELKTRLFNETSIAENSGTEVIYLAQGELMCAEPGAPLDADCVRRVNDLELRVAVRSRLRTSSFTVLVGPERDWLGTVDVTTGDVAGDIGLTSDLSKAKPAIAHLRKSLEADFAVPSVLEGDLRVSLELDGETAGLFVSGKDVKIVSETLNIELAGGPDFHIKVDPTMEKFETTLDLEASSLRLPWATYDSDTDTEESHELAIDLERLAIDATLYREKAMPSAWSLNLGDAPLKVAIDGAQVLSVNLSSLDATVRLEDAGALVTVSPSLDLTVDFDLAAAPTTLHVAEWMLDDVLTVKFEGDVTPSARIGEQLEVLAGTLTMALENEGSSLVVGAGQCFALQEDDAASTPPGDESGEEPGSTEAQGSFDVDVVSCG